MKYASLLALLALIGCGAEAPPSYAQTPETGLNVSGEVTIGVKTKL